MDELSAAGIFHPALRESFLACKKLNAEHGKTYYLATLLLPPAKRPFVHALYGFARFADDIVDNLDPNISPEEKSNKLRAWAEARLAEISAGKSSDQIGAALIETIERFEIPLEYFSDFLNSMLMDLTVTSYQTFADLEKYIYGSASVIGLQMLPILGVSNSDSNFAQASRAAIDLGNAFQLANFIRDVKEDLVRGRIYLPLTELAQFGITPADLAKGEVTENLKAALKFQIKRVRDLQANAEAGIKYLSKDSQPCINAASTLYCGIVDEVEKIDYQIFTKRAKTSFSRRGKTFLKAYIQGRRAR